MTLFKDNTLVLTEIKKGNHQAFEYLFKGYFPRLLGYALRFIPDEEQARDLVQECFATLWEKRVLIVPGSLCSLLFTMVRNSCLNHLKHQQVVKKQQLTYLENQQGEEQLFYADMMQHTDCQLLLHELQEQIDRVVESLPERCREVFLLSRQEGLKNREIAEKLNISTTAVEKHIAKALARFQHHPFF